MKHFALLVLLFSTFCAATAQTIRVPWYEIEAAPGAGYLTRSTSVDGDGEWYQIAQATSGDTIVVWNPLTLKFEYRTKASLLSGLISLTSLSATTPLQYNNATGVFSILQAGAAQNGYVSSTDWNTFNNKQNNLGGTGIVKSTAGTISYLTDNTANWDNAYTNRITSLTTTGTSGAATLASNTLNIPNYTLAGLGGEPAITAGTTLQYYRGDKTFQTLTTAAVTELTNLYYTDARVRAALSLTTTGASGSATYNSSTGVLNVPTYTLSGLGGQPQLNGTGFVKASGTTISYDNTTYLPQASMAGTANQFAYFSATNTLTSGTDLTRAPNRVSVKTLLNLPSYSTVGRPAAFGVRDLLYDNTLQGYVGHNGTRAGVFPFSTFATGTATYIPYLDADGQLTQSANLLYNNNLVLTTASASNGLSIVSTVSSNAGTFTIRPNSSAVGSPPDFTISAAPGRLFFGAYEAIFSGDINAGSAILTGTLAVGYSTLRDGILNIRKLVDNLAPAIKLYDKQGFFLSPIGYWNQGDIHVAFSNSLNATPAEIPTDSKVVFKNTGEVLIGTTTLDPSAVLNIVSTTKGFLVPRMTSAQRNAIASPATSLLVFNTTNSELNIYKNSQWETLQTFGSGSRYSTSTDANGEMTVTHGLGYSPNVVVATVSGTTPYLITRTTTTTTIFKLKFYTAGGAVAANTAIDFDWIAKQF